MSNYTLLRADRATHFKIAAVSIVAAVLLVGIGYGARPRVPAIQQGENSGAMLKSKATLKLTSRDVATVR
jgi:hypothetical protein